MSELTAKLTKSSLLNSIYFFGTLVGITPQLFIISSLGSGLDQIIKNNSSPPSIIEIIASPDIYIPIIAFVFLVIIISFLKKKLIN